MTGPELLERTALFVNGASRTGAKAYPAAREALLARGLNLLRCEAVKDPAGCRTRSGGRSRTAAG